MSKNEMAVNNKGGKISPINAMTNLMGIPKVRDMFDNTLKENSGAFITSLIDLYNSDNYLQKCEPEAVMMEALKAATLNLQINKSLGFAYIVPFGNTPTLVIGYKGLIQLAMRTGQYKHINAGVIYEGMELDEDILSGTFSITGKKQSDKVIGYFAYFKLINGFEKALYMDKNEVEAYGKKYSKTYSNGPWSSEFDTMGQKTVIRQLLGKYGVMSTEMQNVIKEEEDNIVLKEVEDNANKQVLGAGPGTIEVEGTIVDTETGEVIEEPEGINFDDIPGPVPF